MKKANINKKLNKHCVCILRVHACTPARLSLFCSPVHFKQIFQVWTRSLTTRMSCRAKLSAVASSIPQLSFFLCSRVPRSKSSSTQIGTMEAKSKLFFLFFSETVLRFASLCLQTRAKLHPWLHHSGFAFVYLQKQ